MTNHLLLAARPPRGPVPATAATHSGAGAPSFGGLLRSWRAARRYSQFELALQTQVSQRHLSFLESGRAQPSRDMVLHLAQALGGAKLPKGIGRKFLDIYGDRLDRKVRRILEQRTAKNEWASTLFERAKTMPSDTGDQLRGKARRLRQEVKLGEYAMEDAVSPKRGPQVEHDRAASGPDLDQELT